MEWIFKTHAKQLIAFHYKMVQFSKLDSVSDNKGVASHGRVKISPINVQGTYLKTTFYFTKPKVWNVYSFK